MYIPDCRTDEVYNVDNLNENDKAEVRGYDWCADTAVDTFFENLDTYFADDSVLMDVLTKELPASMQREYDTANGEHRTVKTYGDFLRMNLLVCIESERDEMIVSMIDRMEFEAEGDE